MDWKQQISDISNKLDNYVKDNERLRTHIVEQTRRADAREDTLRTTLTDLQKANSDIAALKVRLASLESTAAERDQLEADKTAFDKSKKDTEQLHYQKGYLAAVAEYFAKAGGQVST